MTQLRILLSRFVGLFRKQKLEAELAEEVRSHMEMQIEENRRHGMSPEEARYAALRSFGGVEQTKERYRDRRGLPSLESFAQDIRYALRGLRRSPGFTAMAVITLALGIGATAAIFTVVNAVLLRPLPYPHPEQLVSVQENWADFGLNPFVWDIDFAAWEKGRTLNQVAAYEEQQFNLTGRGEPQRVSCGLASSSFFQLLGVHPLSGRLFLPADDRPGAQAVAILTETLWRHRYGADPTMVGRGITLDGETFTVVGVLPRNFMVPDRYHVEHDLWVPLATNETPRPKNIVRVIGRLSPGLTAASARAELDTLLEANAKKVFKKSVVVSSWHEQIVEKSRLALLLFLGAVGFLLLIACVNVANLLLSRATSRQKEIAVRLTVGARRMRVVRQLLTESCFLALLSSLLGMVLAQVTKDLLVKFIATDLPALGPVRLDFRVLGFGMMLALITGLAFGLVPALHASKVSLNDVLKEAGRSAAGFRSGRLFRNLLITCEAALAVVLLVGAGLLFRSFLRVRGINQGFQSAHTLSLTIDLTLSKYPSATKQAKFFEQAMDNIKALAGVQAVGGSSCPPLGFRTSTVSDLALEGRPESISRVAFDHVSPDYFRTLEIPLLSGRYFAENDREGSAAVAIINQSFARRYFRDEDCLGRRIASWIHRGDWLTIVGVVGDVRSSAERDPEPEIYVPYLQAGQPFMTLLVRTGGNPMNWAGAIRSSLANIDKEQPLYGMASLDDLREESFTPRRVNLLLLGAFAALGLVLACVGIYGVVSYSVCQRTHEIGIRLALGAERGDVVKIVIAQGLRSALIGIAAGVAAALALSRFLEFMLFGVARTDPATFVVVVVSFAAVTLLATYLPARRATKVDPMVALRYE